MATQTMQNMQTMQTMQDRAEIEAAALQNSGGIMIMQEVSHQLEAAGVCSIEDVLLPDEEFAELAELAEQPPKPAVLDQNQSLDLDLDSAQNAELLKDGIHRLQFLQEGRQKRREQGEQIFRTCMEIIARHGGDMTTANLEVMQTLPSLIERAKKDTEKTASMSGEKTREGGNQGQRLVRSSLSSPN